MSSTPSGAVIRVLVVNDHPLFCEGVASIFDADPSIELVGVVGTAGRSQAEIGRLRPDVVLVDIDLPDGSGFDVCAMVRDRYPDVRFVALTATRVPQFVMKAFALGVDGFVVKSATPDQIRHAVRLVAAGETYIDLTVAECVVGMRS